jgi:hypothetical protein
LPESFLQSLFGTAHSAHCVPPSEVASRSKTKTCRSCANHIALQAPVPSAQPGCTQTRMFVSRPSSQPPMAPHYAMGPSAQPLEHFWEAEDFSFQGQQAIREPHVLFFDSTQSFSHVFYSRRRVLCIVIFTNIIMKLYGRDTNSPQGRIWAAMSQLSPLAQNGTHMIIIDYSTSHILI